MTRPTIPATHDPLALGATERRRREAAARGSKATTDRGVVRYLVRHRRMRAKQGYHARRVPLPPVGRDQWVYLRALAFRRSAERAERRAFSPAERAERRAAADPVYRRRWLAEQRREAARIRRDPTTVDEPEAAYAAIAHRVARVVPRAAALPPLRIMALVVPSRDDAYALAVQYGAPRAARRGDWRAVTTTAPSGTVEAAPYYTWRDSHNTVAGRVSYALRRSGRVEYHAAEYTTILRALAWVDDDGALGVCIHRTTRRHMPAAGYVWRLDPEVGPALVRVRDGASWHPTAAEMMAEATGAAYVAQLRLHALRRRAARRPARTGYVTIADARRAGYCAAGVAAWLARHGVREARATRGVPVAIVRRRWGADAQVARLLERLST